AILPDTLTNQAMKESDAYKTYYDFATGNVIPKLNNEDDDDEVSLSKDDDDNADNEDDDGQDNDNEHTKLDNDGDDFVHPKFSTHDEEERQDEEDKEEEGSDLRVQIPSHFESTDDEAYDEVTQGDNVEEEELDEEEINKEEELNELYRDVNINLERRDTEMTDALQTNVQGFISNMLNPNPDTDDEAYDEVTQGDNVEDKELDEEETNEEEEVNDMYKDVNINLERRDTEMIDALQTNVQGFISNMLNPNSDIGIDSILNLNTESTSLVDVPVTTNVEIPPSSVTTPPPSPIPLIQPLQQTPVPTPIIVPSSSLQNLPTFGSLFKFEDRVKALEDDFLEFKQTNLFAEVVSSIPNIIDKYLANQMNEAVKAAAQL
ncbi:hypothetical protein Tco_1324575, partial [Tanacetum coccineum]